jgi:hypothetical protein
MFLHYYIQKIVYSALNKAACARWEGQVLPVQNCCSKTSMHDVTGSFRVVPKHLSELTKEHTYTYTPHNTHRLMHICIHPKSSIHL